MKEYAGYAKEMLEFIEKCPSSFHVVENIKRNLLGEGFLELKENLEWELSWGKGYFVIRNDSSVIAFRLPSKGEASGFHIVAAHGDSPTFKLKETPEIRVEEKYIKLNTERYGGMILSTWLDRALSVAGRVAMYDEKEERVVTKLINIDKDLLVIPNVAIHMNHDINKGAEYNPQSDMLPLYADCGESNDKGSLQKKIAEAAGVKAENILGQDLFLYVREKGRILGENGEFVLSPKLDDLQCVYASMKAFTESKPTDYINVCAVFDNEEVEAEPVRERIPPFWKIFYVVLQEGFQRREADIYNGWRTAF